MNLLVVIALTEFVLLAGTIWSTRRPLARVRAAAVRRKDGLPHAL